MLSARRAGLALPKPSGFTLFEITVAFGILLIVIVGVWSLLANANWRQEQLWDELAARELATSVLEEALAKEKCELTPPQGQPVQFAPPAAALFALQVTLHVAAVPQHSDLLQLRAVVKWSERGHERSLEASLRRRAAP